MSSALGSVTKCNDRIIKSNVLRKFKLTGSGFLNLMNRSVGKKGCYKDSSLLSITINCIRLQGLWSGNWRFWRALNYFVIAISPRFTLIQSGSTCYIWANNEHSNTNQPFIFIIKLSAIHLLWWNDNQWKTKSIKMHAFIVQLPAIYFIKNYGHIFEANSPVIDFLIM